MSATKTADRKKKPAKTMPPSHPGYQNSGPAKSHTNGTFSMDAESFCRMHYARLEREGRKS